MARSASPTDASPQQSDAVVVGALDDEDDAIEAFDETHEIDDTHELDDEAGEADLGERDVAVPSATELASNLLRSGLRLTDQRPAADTSYALDAVSRLLRSDEAHLSCSSRGLLTYGGSKIRFGGPAVVNASFRDRLERFEQVVSDVALAAYGRAPVRIRHRGAFACRSRRGQPLLLSEHALGNAIDVSGFDFGPASAGTERIEDAVPSTAFRISVARHWLDPKGPIDLRHARFLHSVIARLVARGDVFRGIITPKDAAHSDHFHFDMAREGHVRL